jgi:hypothetical protein
MILKRQAGGRCGRWSDLAGGVTIVSVQPVVRIDNGLRLQMSLSGGFLLNLLCSSAPLNLASAAGTVFVARILGKNRLLRLLGKQLVLSANVVRLVVPGISKNLRCRYCQWGSVLGFVKLFTDLVVRDAGIGILHQMVTVLAVEDISIRRSWNLLLSPVLCRWLHRPL